MEYVIIVLVGALVAIIAAIIISRSNSAKQKKEREDAIKLQRLPYEKLAADFARVGWSAWGYAIHRMAGQDDRIQRAIHSKEMRLLSFDAETRTAIVLGERGATYTIDSKGCSCLDFSSRGLPCKHMYFSVM